MKYLIDTNVVSDTLRDAASPAAMRMRSEDVGVLCIPSIVRAELVYGAFKSGSFARVERIQRFLAPFPSLPFDDSAVEEYGRLRFKLEAGGMSIGSMDLLIASLALHMA